MVWINKHFHVIFYDLKIKYIYIYIKRELKILTRYFVEHYIVFGKKTFLAYIIPMSVRIEVFRCNFI